MCSDYQQQKKENKNMEPKASVLHSYLSPKYTNSIEKVEHLT